MTREEYLVAFEQITKDMLETTKRKNSDYTNGLDPFKNFTMVETMGVSSTEQGFFTRMTDKLMRLATFVSKKELMVADEKVEDTLQDLAVYSILFICYLRSKK
jgi:hypothetical protein